MNQDFGDFTGFSHTPSNSSVPLESNAAGTNNNGSQRLHIDIDDVTKFAPFDVNFDIEPPISPPLANVHLAGGVPFDIPPLPDNISFDDFSPDMDIENPFDSASLYMPSSSSIATTTAGNKTAVQTAVQPVAHFTSPPMDTEWSANFGSFDIPPPIDAVESSGDLAQTLSESSAHVQLDSIVPESEVDLTMPPPLLESDTLELIPSGEKEIALPIN